MRWAWHVARTLEKANEFRIFLKKTGGKIALARPRHGWVDNIKMDLTEIEWDSMDCNDLAQDRDRWMALVNTVMNPQVP
jgi:hypothetical protein